MSAEPYEFSFDLLKAMARRIVNEVDGVSRVTYDLEVPFPVPILKC
jgi:GMP synthase (glutamine-hydrolysing)